MPYAKREDVESFLAKLHHAIQSGFYVVDRDKNFNFLLLHGFSVQDRREAIESLCVENYFGGPEKDRDFPAQPACIWKFAVTLEGVDIYIKLKIVEEGAKVRVKCLSFHEPEQPITHYPYKR
ncbi:MAG: hypothetical protein NTY77_06275 [Elusimicrobia bacterium]|nr:hypothetical protein [Elusimicrobiota bacterium]